MNQKTQSILIVGGGWAGLSAAVALCSSGQKVTLIEGSKQLGGRARSIKMGATRVDNGQHLMLGAYTDVLALMRTLNVPESDVLLRQNLRLNVQCLDGSQLDLSAPNLPAPLHLLVAFLRCKGLSLKEKLQGLLSMDKLMKQRLSADKDCSVQDMLTRCRVPKNVQDKLQIPLCIAALNTQPEYASARVFIAVLNEAFKTKRAASDLLIATRELDHVVATPAHNYLTEHGGEVLLDTRASELLFDDQNRLKGITCQDGNSLYADHVILATQHHQAHKLLKRAQQAELTPLCSALERFTQEPIITLYYQFPEHVTLNEPMTGLLGGYGEWVFDRAFSGQKGLLAVVISASGDHLNLKHNALSDIVLSELKTLWPELPEPNDVLVVKESNATFHCGVGIDAIRPENQTAIPNLWLAGDYTNTGFPATLEGAVRSANDCARAIQALSTH